MAKGEFLVCVLMLFVFAVCNINGSPLENESLRDIKDTVAKLFETVTSLQVKQDQSFSPPLNWEKRKGMYESDVRFYFHGPEELYLAREAFKVYDDNMFSTTWITSCLLETFRYGQGPKPAEDQIMSSVLAVREYHNKNVNYPNSLMTFWPQLFNSTTRSWQSYPTNLHQFFQLVANFNATELEHFLDLIGLDDIAKIMEQLLKTERGYLQAFLIPPDFDDTFVNIGLGSLLNELEKDFPQSHAQWHAQNTNVTSVFNALKKYAYRPMSDNKAVNTIDCRTYFYIRKFLQEAESRNEDIMLVPTWIQDLDELKTWINKGVIMPLNTNNVDVTVAANTIFGTTAAILNGLVAPSILDDPVFHQIYLNTTNLIIYMIEANFSSRPDLALLYYPSAIEFYWFVARTFGELQTKYNEGPLPHPLLETVRKNLYRVLRGPMTEVILNASKTDDGQEFYYDDFLGDGDVDIFNRTKIRGEDRLFTTGMAINALLSTWTIFDDKTKQLKWEPDTPANVKTTVSGAATFLQKNVLGRKYKPWNAFFSGSVKGFITYPVYPTNRLVDVSQEEQSIRIFGVEGIIPEAEYQELIKKGVGHFKVPIDFHGYNAVPDFWPFWCSEAYTYVTTMLALAKFSNTV